MLNNRYLLLIVGTILMIGTSCKKDPYYFSFGKTNPQVHSNSLAASGANHQALSASKEQSSDLSIEPATVSEKQESFTRVQSREEAKAENSTLKKDNKALIKSLRKLPKITAKANRPSRGESSQTVAFVLALAPLLIGLFGIHRFYLGGGKNIAIGIVQLLTLGCCGIWQLIDIIRIATGELKPRSGEYTEKW